MNEAKIKYHGQASIKDWYKDQKVVYSEKKKCITPGYYYTEEWIKVLSYLVETIIRQPEGYVFFQSNKYIMKALNKKGCSITERGVEYALWAMEQVNIIERIHVIGARCNNIPHRREIKLNTKLLYKLYAFIGKGDPGEHPFFAEEDIKAKSRLKKVIRKRPFTVESKNYTLRKMWELIKADKLTKTESEKALFAQYLKEISSKYYSTSSYTHQEGNPDQKAFLERKRNKGYELKLNQRAYNLAIQQQTKGLSIDDIAEYGRYGIITIGNMFMLHFDEIVNKYTSKTAYMRLLEEIRGQADAMVY